MDAHRILVTQVDRKEPWPEGQTRKCTSVSVLGEDPISGGGTTSVTVVEWANGEGVDVNLLCGGDDQITKLELTWDGMDILVDALSRFRGDWTIVKTDYGEESS